jgi:NAD(P)H-dependent flavin oxidoreductase YrpB (nitropropane dioxygenase family)
VNCLEKVQIPLVYSFFGAMLAGADFLVIGAGIPNQVANVLNLLAEGQPATYRISLEDAEAGESAEVTFDPRAYCGAAWDSLTIRRPDFLPIVSSPVLAEMLLRKAPENGIQGFVVEHHTAGGHNAPPRGWKGGEVNYGPRDEPDMAKLRALGVPFWLAGSYGSPERLQEALSEGASGIQVGTAFAYCAESGYRSDLKKAVLELALADTLTIETSGKASPTGFPFKIPQIDGTLSDPKIYDRRPRRCGPGLLRVPYQKANGSVGYRCAAEPEAAFEAKGGSPEETEGRVCLCEALFAAAGLPQEKIGGGTEPPLLTCGEDFGFVSAIMGNTYREYTAADVVRYLLGANSHA